MKNTKSKSKSNEVMSLLLGLLFLIAFIPMTNSFAVTTPALKQSVVTKACGAVSSCSIIYGSNVAKNSLLVIAINGYSTGSPYSVSTVADSATNRYSMAGKSSGQYSSEYLDSEIWFAVSNSSVANTVTITMSGTFATLDAEIYEVVPINQTGNNAVGFNSAAVTTGFTSAVTFPANSFLISSMATASILIAGSGFTVEQTGNGFGSQYALNNVTSPTTFPFTMNPSFPSGYAEIGVAFILVTSGSSSSGSTPKSIDISIIFVIIMISLLLSILGKVEFRGTSAQMFFLFSSIWGILTFGYLLDNGYAVIGIGSILTFPIFIFEIGMLFVCILVPLIMFFDKVLGSR
jgi:hypothetical protein